MLAKEFIRTGPVIGVLLIALAAGGCSGMNSTEQRTLSGAAAGAAGGAALGALTGGSAAAGAIIGGGAGAAGGYLFDQSERNDD